MRHKLFGTAARATGILTNRLLAYVVLTITEPVTHFF